MPKQGNAAEEKYLPLKFFNEISRRVLSTPQYVEPELKFPKYYYRGMGVDMVNRFTGDIGESYNNAHPSAQLSLSVATTIVEYGLIGPLAIGLQVPYDLYSGSHFITIPTSPAGWIGYSLSGTAE